MTHEADPSHLREPILQITLGLTPEQFEPIREEFILDLARIMNISASEIQDIQIIANNSAAPSEQ